MWQRALSGSGGGGGATLLWENPDTSSAPKLAAGTLTISGLENYDFILFEMYDETDYGSNNIGYTGFPLSDLSTQRAVGWTNKQPTYVYVPYRLVQHTATNELTISTGHYFRAGSSDATSTGYAPFTKIYGINL